MRFLILVTIIISNNFIVCSQNSSVNEINFVQEISNDLNGIFIDSLNSIKWTPYPKEVIATSEDGYAYTSIDSIISYTSNNEFFKLVVLSTNVVSEGFIFECAGCAPTLGLALYKFVDGKYVLTSCNRSIRRIGQAGHLPETYSIVDLSQNSKGFLINEDNFMDNDIYSFIYSLSEYDVFSLLFDYPNFRIKDRASNPYNFQTTTLSFIEKNLEYEVFYDIKLDITSFKSEKKIGTKSLIYTYNGKRWEPIK